MTSVLEVEHLGVTLPVDGVPQPVLHDVSLTIAAGECLGLVGESGSGKSMTVRAIDGLLPRGSKAEGKIRFEGRDVLGIQRAELRRFRSQVALIFQDPRAHINPVRRIGDFMVEYLTQQGSSRRAAEEKAHAALADVGITDGPRRMHQYPHELSGGLLQRVMIAGALLTEPRLLLADEPTTALDVTTQAEVMGIIDGLRRERGLAVLFITHDLDLAAAVCDRIAVMYAGSIVESGSVESVYEKPLHPYSAALAAARPRIDETVPRLAAIGGRPVSAFEAPPGCAFMSRCAHAEERCGGSLPALREVAGGQVRCVRAEELIAHA